MLVVVSYIPRLWCVLCQVCLRGGIVHIDDGEIMRRVIKSSGDARKKCCIASPVDGCTCAFRSLVLSATESRRSMLRFVVMA